ncbi:thiamine pyrophosphate-dependent enzyme [Sphingomonas sp. MMS24-JH45]
MATRCRSAGTRLRHLLRRNLDCQFLLFNNEIYGLTKGNIRPPRASARNRPPPRSVGAANPCAFALGAGARFVARGIDVHKSLPTVLKAAHAHKGTSFVEIFQNRIVYNDDVFAPFTDKKQGADQNQLWVPASRWSSPAAPRGWRSTASG